MHGRAVPAILTLALAGCPEPDPPECSTYDEVFVWTDADGDGYGRDEAIGYVCEPGPNQATNKVDCDDESPDVSPESEEVCDLLDNDCNGVVDDPFPKLPWFEDADGDGVGVQASQTEPRCLPPTGTWVNVAGDCDDSNADVRPTAIEQCNGFDDDCDELTDDDDPGVDPTTYLSWYPDDDNDGYGDVAFVIDACSPPVPEAIPEGGDCDDGAPGINPDATEVCDLVDNDCDGDIDDADPTIDPSTQTNYFADDDGDGYGDATQLALACRPTAGYGVDNDLDCDDTDPLVNVPQDWYFDGDGDGWGIGASLGYSCFPPAPDTGPYLGDCDDGDPFEHPDVLEDCFDGYDQNCNGDFDCDDADCSSEPTCVQPCADLVTTGAPPITELGSTVGQGDDMSPLTCAYSNAFDVVFQWVAPATALYTFDTGGSAYDTVLYVRDGCSNVELACNDDAPGLGLDSRVTVSATAGQVLMIVVDGYGIDRGNFVLHIN